MTEEQTGNSAPSDLWFRKTSGGIGFAPTDWRGRAVLALYIFLSVTAIFTYGNLALTGLVFIFYTAMFIFALVAKSDLFEGRFPPR